MDSVFFDKQLECWDLAKSNYEALDVVMRRMFYFDGFQVEVLFNPARVRSTTAKVDERSIAERQCFLCEANRPKCQTALLDGEFHILVNPYPIFSPHYTIAHRSHTPQLLLPALADMLRLTRSLTGMALFYNGPRCGASAPDHLHFQACSADSFRVIADYFAFNDTRLSLISESENIVVKSINNYLRTVVCIESADAQMIIDYMRKAMDVLADESNVEPMMNVVTYFFDHKFYLWMFPRKAFRPWQFSADEPKALLFSPAAVEMTGTFITPSVEHFFKILPDDVVDIYDQVSMHDVVGRLKSIL